MLYTDDRDLPEISDEEFSRLRSTARPYTVVILKAGSRFIMPGPDRDQDVTNIIMQHGKRNVALRAAGLMPIICPIGDGSGICGVSVFDASPDEVFRIMSDDPGVKTDVFTFEIHPSRGFPGSTLP
jgi:hypothetical protein